jgi:hypothetical protein
MSRPSTRPLRLSTTLNVTCRTRARPGRPVSADEATVDSADVVLTWLDDAFQAAGVQADAGDGGGDGERGERSAEDLARWALNLQDDGSVLYRHATLPLVIGGELRELQVALFTPREPVDGTDVRCPVMTPRKRRSSASTHRSEVRRRAVGRSSTSQCRTAEALAERDGEGR